MPIDSKHPDFKEHHASWIQCSDFNDGAARVKSRGKGYLPIPSGMTNAEFKKYVRRTSFFNGMGRTVTGLVGAMTRIDAKVTLPPLISHLEDNATGNGKTIQEFIKQVLARIMSTGRGGVLTDKPRLNGEINGETRLIFYHEDTIVNWEVEDGKLVLVVLLEHILEKDPQDKYEKKFEPQYRECFITSDGEYKQRIWSKVPTKALRSRAQFTPGPVLDMFSSTGSLTEIPFVFLSPVGTEARVAKAPLLDLCELNLSHYMTSADLEHGRHLTSLPTPWVIGVDGKKDHKDGLKIGSGTAWMIGDPEASIGMLEFTGKGLGHLASAIDEKQHQMAIMGAKLLQPQRKQVESAELARMANSGDESILMGVAKSVGLGLKKALEFAAIWENSSQAVELKMNTDFIDTKLDPHEITALHELYVGGAIDLEELLMQMQIGERLIGDPVKVAAKARIEMKQRMDEQTTSAIMAGKARAAEMSSERVS